MSGTKASSGALLLALLAAASCGTGTGQPVAARGAFASLLAEIPPDGSVSLRTALEAFSLAISPLPGVQVPPGAHDDVPAAAGGAARWLVGHWSELAPSQRAAAERWIGPVGASGLQPTLPVTFTCNGAALQFVYVGSQEADNYRRG